MSWKETPFTPKQNDQMDLEFAIINILFYTNSAVNFWLYTMSAQRFRRELVAMALCTSSQFPGHPNAVQVNRQDPGQETKETPLLIIGKITT